MAEIVEMIQLSPTMEEGILVEWLKKEGDVIASGDLLAEVETDKATMEMESYYEGVLLKILVKDGDAAPVGSAIAIVGEEGENIDDLLAEVQNGGSADASDSDEDVDPDDDDGAEEEQASDEEAGEDADSDEEDGDEEQVASGDRDSDSDEDADSEKDDGADTQEATGDGDDENAGDDEEQAASGEASESKSASSGHDGKRILASPVARKLAEEHNVDLAQVEGSGPAGRVIKDDVQQAIDSGSAQKGAAKKSAKSSKPQASSKQKAPAATKPVKHGGEDVKLTPMRKSIAKTLTESWKAPAFMLTRTVTMDRTIEFRKRLNEKLEANDEPRISINDIIIKACATALVDVPEMNSSFEGDHIHLYEHANIGFAVAIEGGLITPIVAAAETLGLRNISQQTRELAERARNKKLKPGEFTGASFSISNLGMFGIEHFTAVLNPPGAGILAVGTIRKEPVFEDDQLVPRQRMSITLTCDHRAVDGALGARFLDYVATYLDDPMMMLS